MCLLYGHLSFLFLCRLCIWKQHCLRLKDLLFILLGFLRHASLRDRSPESSEPHATLDSRSSLIRTTFGVHTSFFPGSHLRVSCTDQILRFTRRILSHNAARRDNMCLLSPSKGIKWWASSGSFYRNEFLRKVVIEYKIPSFHCNINIIEFVVSHVLAFLQSSTRIVYLWSKEFRFNNINLGNKEWFFSGHASWTLGSTWWQWVKYPWVDQNYSRASASSSDSSSRNSSLSPWDSPLRFSLSLWCLFPSQKWVLGIRSLSLIILLNHLPQEIQILHLFGLSKLLSQVFSLRNQTISFPKSHPRTKHVLEGFDKSSFMFRIPVCHEVLLISQIATAFHKKSDYHISSLV